MVEINKLKTLKDLSWNEDDVPSHCLNIEHPVCCSVMLKEEAIKWIKHLESQKGIGPDEQEKFDFNNQLDDFISSDDDYLEVMSWIKWFFNITEKELK
jgi:hypothetical protein